jgi:hypothetical protein
VGKGNGEGKGRGRSVYKQPGTGWTGVEPHAKERFQVSKRDLGTGEGSPGKGAIIKGNYQGYLSRGLCHGLSYCQPCIYISCYCVYVANKRIVFRL